MRVPMTGPFLVAALAATPVAKANDVRAYASECNTTIEASVEGFNCLSGTILDMVGDEGGDCEKPPYLPGAGCHKYSRIGEIPTSDPDKYGIVFLCRHKEKASGPNDHIFDDIAVVQTNYETGATCFYQALGDDLDGRTVPKPDSDDGAAYWMDPPDMARKDVACAECHDNGAFIRTPYVMQAGLEALKAKHRNKDKYYFPGDRFLGWNGKVLRVILTSDSKYGASCTASCHKMGANLLTTADDSGTGRWLTTLSTGIDPTPLHKGPLGKYWVWMSPGNANKVDEPNQFNSIAVKDCAIAKDPNTIPGCVRAPWGGQVEALLRDIETLSRQVDAKRR